MFPGMAPTDPRVIHGAANVRSTLARRDCWADRREARVWLLGGAPRRSNKEGNGKGTGDTRGSAKGNTVWARWDRRVLDLYVVCHSSSSLDAERAM